MLVEMVGTTTADTELVDDDLNIGTDDDRVRDTTVALGVVLLWGSVLVAETIVTLLGVLL